MLFVAIFCLMSIFPILGQDIPFDVSHSIDWVKGEISSQVGFSLASADIKLPTGRYLAEEILQEAFPGILRPCLLSLRVDSGAIVRDAADRRELLLDDLDLISLGADRPPPNLSTDLSRIGGRYTVSMTRISALLTRHRRAIEPERPLIPAHAADYTGIIIIADGELPVHGRRAQALAEPCLFPKIWDTNMSLIYERNMFEPALREERLMVRYASRESIFRPTPSGLSEDLAALVGPNPYRILAREVFGTNPTDPIIDRDDALLILSTENNRRLLREGRVALVLSGEMLR